MSDEQITGKDKDPAPLEHVDAQRLTSDKSRDVPEGEDTQGEEETEQQPG